MVESSQRWVVDRNGDGFADDAVARLIVDVGSAADRQFWGALLDLTASIGLETHALPFPLVGTPADDLPPGIESVVLHGLGDIPVVGGDDVVAQAVSTSPTRPASDCLTRLFTLDGALEDRDGDRLPDASRIAFDLPDVLPVGLGVALANFAARIGLESGGVTFPLVRDGDAPFVVRPGAGEATLRAGGGGWWAEGDADELALLIERVAANWPYITAPETGGAGSALALLARWLSGDGPEPDELGEVVYEREWSATWEGDALLDHVAEVLASLTSQTVADYQEAEDIHDDLFVFACEPPAQREQLAASIRGMVAKSPFTGIHVTVLSSFKVGLSWLREVVIPELTPLAANRVRVVARRHTSEEPNGLDMPIRWLQELFPGDELILAATGLAPEQVEFDVSDDVASIYMTEAYDDDGALLARWECDPPSMTAPFINALPDVGTVRVTTSGTAWYWDGELDVSLSVPSDLQTFWAFWQDEVIPEILALIDRQGGPLAGSQPFFDELLAEVWISAPNEQIGLREENDSAAEALAEEIYFTTLDAIEAYGRQQTGERCTAPGAVIPIVHVTPGQPPRARVTLRSAPARRALPRPTVRVAGLRLGASDPVLEIDITVDGESDRTAARLAELSSLPTPTGPSIPATLHLGDMTVDLRLPLPELLSAQHTAASAPPMDENIHGDRVVELAGQLSTFPEVAAWIEDRSYQGRPLVALALLTPTPGRLASATKAAIFKPTYLVVARHHANEISSTNAAFRLAWLTANDPEWRALLDRVNIIVLPYENPDGAALHARLAAFPEARTWKHHPARYNALGYEFGEAHFDPATPYGEARARLALWQRWPADLVVDNHGVPSHEWVQPFAGFGSPPRFGVSYWIVQALLYGIVRYVDDDEYPEHQAAAIALRDAVSAIVRDTDIGDWNRVYGASYRNWGQSYLPERFPGEFHDDMLWHIGSGPADPAGRGFASRFPKTTVLSWVTEVNDETAEGEHLERVARAHLLANRATLDLLHAAAPALERTRTEEEGRSTLRVGRRRPLRLH